MAQVIVKRRYSVLEAARLLGRTPGEVRRMLANGEIQGEKLGDKTRSHWWIGGDELQRLLGAGGGPAFDEAAIERIAQRTADLVMERMGLRLIGERRAS